MYDQGVAVHDVLGVGIIGAGPVTQALHIPMLARLPELYQFVHLTAPSPRAAPDVANRVGARYSDTVDALLADPAVDVVAINSPSALHAEHALQAMRAGKRALFIEKPLATTLEDAVAVVEMAEQTGTVLIVGTMHVFDPAWTRANEAFGDLIRDASVIRASAILPPNPLVERWCGEVLARAGFPSPPDLSIPPVRAGVVQAVTLNLAIHSIPLIRAALPNWRAIEVLSAQPLPPFGHHQFLACGDARIQMLANMHTHRWWDWSVEFESRRGSVTVASPLSYAPAGSGTVTARTDQGEIRLPASHETGYEVEWRHLHAMATRGSAPMHSARESLDDLEFAIRIAAGAAAKAQEILA